MKPILTILLFVLVACTNTETQKLPELSATEAKILANFELAVKQASFAETSQMLAATAENKALFCAMTKKSDKAIIDSFLSNIGFSVWQNKAYTVNFKTICNFNHASVGCLMAKVTDVQNIEQQLGNTLKIAGATLCNRAQRDSFIRIEILKNKEVAADDLHFISMLIKFKPTDSDFQTAFNSIVELADKNTVALYLKKQGYVEFNGKTDEYTTYRPEKIAHLPEHVRTKLLAKAGYSK